ncbi:MAG: Rieske (2Fe-2S) protein [Thermomicrobiales bacterium]|jgi:cytochrome b6-f complex iron-sulfur subunit|nr:cytochrome B6 [Chloroflexota bacterium]
MENMNRREFVRNAIIGGAGLVVAATGGLILLTRKSGNERYKGELTVPKADIPKSGADPASSDSGHFHLINNEDGALALYWACTHQGCKVPWQEGQGQFHCPCHNSTFDRHGVVTSGPAPRPLSTFPISVTANGDIVVNTVSATSRNDYEPDQSVKLGSA